MLKLLTSVAQVYCHPDTPIGSAGPGIQTGGGGGKESTIEFLASDDEPELIPLDDKKTPPREPKKTTPTETPEEEDEPEEENTDEESDEDSDEDEDEDEELSLEDEFEDDLKEPTEEDLELVTPVRRREILAKYPNLFKDFPYLEKAYWREQQFTEVFPTIDDAKSAREDAQILGKFEGDLLKGNIETVLKAVKDKSPNSFNKVANDYLKTLANVDERAYLNVISNLTKHTISSMAAKARSSNNEALMQAATILNQFVFGSDEWVPPKELPVEEAENKENPKSKEIEDREKAFNQRQFDTARTDINTRVGNSLKATIDANIDPKKAMTDYVRKNASRDAMEILTGLIAKDTRFKALNEKLWEAAFKANFSKESTDRIRAAHLSKAKTLLPSVLKKARIDALRGMGKRVRETPDDNTETTERKAPVAARKPASSGNKGGQRVGKVTNAKDIPKGMSTLEFLNSD